MGFFHYDDENRVKPKIACGEGRTKQSMRDESDINLIMAKYKKNRVVDFVNERQGEYMNVETLDFHTAMNIIKNAQMMFDEMPSHLRKRFDNDPGKFLEFTQDENNLDEMVILGLANEPEGWVHPDQKKEEPLGDVENTGS